MPPNTGVAQRCRWPSSTVLSGLRWASRGWERSDGYRSPNGRALPMMCGWLPGTAAMHCRTRRAIPKVGRKPGYGSRDLRAARNRWLDRVGKVGVLAADETQVDQREAMEEGLPRDDVVEQGQSDDGEAPALRIGEARVVDGAE